MKYICKCCSRTTEVDTMEDIIKVKKLCSSCRSLTEIQRISRKKRLAKAEYAKTHDLAKVDLVKTEKKIKGKSRKQSVRKTDEYKCLACDNITDRAPHRNVCTHCHKGRVVFIRKV